MKLTKDFLIENNCCEEEIKRFEKTYSDGIDIPDDCAKIIIKNNDEIHHELSYLSSDISWLISTKIFKNVVIAILENDGFWKRYIVDDMGHAIETIDSNGYSTHRKYSGDIVVYFKNSNDYWEKREHDLKYNIISYENSEGDIIKDFDILNTKNKIVKRYDIKKDVLPYNYTFAF